MPHQNGTAQEVVLGKESVQNQYRNENKTNPHRLGVCLKKCCPEKLYVQRKLRVKLCVPYTERKLEISYPVYDEELNPTGKTVQDSFVFETNAFSNKTFKLYTMQALIRFKGYILENGKLYLEYPNAFQRWQTRNVYDYCLDFSIPTKNNKEVTLGIWVTFDGNGKAPSNLYLRIAMIISCVFFFIVLVVYSLLPELRNLGGLVLMAYVISLMFAFISLLVIQGTLSPKNCITFTMFTYFFFLATFCWMNVMSYDIWWTFRGYAKARPIHRRGEKFKFLMYALYAWGLPLAMTISLYFLNSVDLQHIPWLVLPKIPDKGCFLEGGEKFLYLYCPMLIMILLNWLFFLMTAFNIWRLSRGTAVLDSAAAGNTVAHRTHRHRLMVYVKLSVLMGLNWLLEVVSSFMPDYNIWYISDTFNLLVGFAIFLIFVCKKKIFKKLVKRYMSFRESKWHPSSFHSRSSRSSSTTDSSIVTQETPLRQICINPKGP
ncbi:unnamed protein product [Chilo suppressalis]|uniref:G-protein coupled receptors family 2 profile 2 domain-containing protein n=1 Tax=Chilo suppressalis TaxID=168631 RepID=A0ABN8AY75_CHISP|nr:unnamed protein product [Chilo suppressalis]